MEIEELWSLDDQKGSTCDLRRVEEDDGELLWVFRLREEFVHARHMIDLDRKNLKDLHDAIEHELYPERYLPPVPRKTNYDQLFELMDELGFTEDMINRVIDKIQIKEDEQRKE